MLQIAASLTDDSRGVIYDHMFIVQAGNPYCKGRLSTADLLVLTSLDQLIFILKIFFTFLQNQLT